MAITTPRRAAIETAPITQKPPAQAGKKTKEEKRGAPPSAKTLATKRTEKTYRPGVVPTLR